MVDYIDFPSLNVRLEPPDSKGTATVMDTVARVVIGYVHVPNEKTKTWGWQTVDGAYYGERKDRRAAVEAVRDVRNAVARRSETAGSDTPVPRYAHEFHRVEAQPPKPKAPAHVPTAKDIADTNQQMSTLTAQMRAAFDRRKA